MSVANEVKISPTQPKEKDHSYPPSSTGRSSSRTLLRHRVLPCHTRRIQYLTEKGPHTLRFTSLLAQIFFNSRQVIIYFPCSFLQYIPWFILPRKDDKTKKILKMKRWVEWVSILSHNNIMYVLKYVKCLWATEQYSKVWHFFGNTATGINVTSYMECMNHSINFLWESMWHHTWSVCITWLIRCEMQQTKSLWHGCFCSWMEYNGTDRNGMQLKIKCLFVYLFVHYCT